MAYNSNSGEMYVDTSTNPDTGISIVDLQQCFHAIIQATVNGQTVRRLSGDLGVYCGTKEGSTFTAPYTYDNNGTPTTINNVSWTVVSRNEINKWAKWKPVKKNKVTRLTASDCAGVNYGIINIPTWTVLSKMRNFLISNSRSTETNNFPSVGYKDVYWDYELPAGGVNSPYRLTDFVHPTDATKGYYHNASAPVKPLESYTIQIPAEGLLQIKFPYGTATANTLTLADLTLPDITTSLGNMYFGVILRQIDGYMVSGTNTPRTFIVTQSNNISYYSSPGYGVVEMNLSSSDSNFAGTWNIFPILSSVSVTRTSSIDNINGSFIALLPDHTNPVTFSIVKAKVEIQNVIAYRIESGNSQPTAYFSLRLKNNESVDRRYKITVIICDSNGNQIQNFGNGQNEFSGSTYIAAANTTSSVLVSVNIASLDSDARSNLYYKISVNIDRSYAPNIVFYEESKWNSGYASGPIVEGQPVLE